jgi:hypothetical protein
MKYLCLVYGEERLLAAMSESEDKALTVESLAYDEVLQKGGHFHAAQALESPTTAALVRVRSGKMSVTDGPFAETKEQLLGFILIEARDLDQAIQLASRIPLARIGTIEVRPIKELTV